MKNIFKLILLSFLIGGTIVSCEDKTVEDTADDSSYKNTVVSFDTRIDGRSSAVTFTNIVTTEERYNDMISGLELTVDMDNLKAFATVEGTSLQIEYDLVLNEIGMYDLVEVYANLPEGRVQNFWCALRCGLGAAAIAASDGPSPAMDILAIAYAYECGSNC